MVSRILHRIEVTDEVYTAYMKGDRKIRYFEKNLKTGRTVKDKNGNIKQILPSREDSLDRLMEDNAQQFPDSYESVEDIVIQKSHWKNYIWRFQSCQRKIRI